MQSKILRNFHFYERRIQKTMMESAQYGLPTKLMVNNLNGFSEMDTLALNFWKKNVWDYPISLDLCSLLILLLPILLVVDRQKTIPT